ncbi:MAG: hypothetical protein PHS92_05340 [Candidatus Gracilibacteria bacterium]|nr:hypothetical protein [Candidatus Gracilibacteria bacterium]
MTLIYVAIAFLIIIGTLLCLILLRFLYMIKRLDKILSFVHDIFSKGFTHNIKELLKFRFYK